MRAVFFNFKTNSKIIVLDCKSIIDKADYLIVTHGEHKELFEKDDYHLISILPH